MLTAEQRDYLIGMCNREEEENVRELIQQFAEMHNSREHDEFLTDISIELLEISIEAHRKNHDEAASAIASLAGAIVRPKFLAVFSSMIANAQAVLAAKVIADELSSELKKMKKKKDKGDAS